jgi:threonine/homoserine/homoserine lactone efflux protein
MGALARQLLRSDRALRIFNLVMALLLIASLIPVVLSP